jgi:hypothetical protein
MAFGSTSAVRERSSGLTWYAGVTHNDELFCDDVTIAVKS